MFGMERNLNELALFIATSRYKGETIPPVEQTISDAKALVEFLRAGEPTFELTEEKSTANVN